MSLLKIINYSGVDQTIAWIDSTFIFPSGVPVDLIDEESTDDGDATTHRPFFQIDEILAKTGGPYFSKFKALLDLGYWKMVHPTKSATLERPAVYDEAFYMLCNGTLGGLSLEGESKTVVSHDLCHKTTWWQNSIRETDEVLEVSDTDTAVYSARYRDWINTTEGFIYQEDTITGVGVEIKLNGVAVDEKHYTVSFADGYIEFVDAGLVRNPETDVVTATYSYGKNSVWMLQTDTTHLWRVLKTEVQLDESAIIDGAIIMEIIIDHPVYGDDLVVRQWAYKSVRDLVNGSNLGFQIPSFGGTKLLSGLRNPTVVLPFNYTTPIEMPIGVNTRIRLRLGDDKQPQGDFGTVTIYADKCKL